jgi:hypothetical protein
MNLYFTEFLWRSDDSWPSGNVYAHKVCAEGGVSDALTGDAIRISDRKVNVTNLERC